MDDAVLRRTLLDFLDGEGAHVTLDAALDGFPEELAGRRVEGVAHTMWMLVYHVHVVVWDILEFIRDPGHDSPDYPSGYWPKGDAPPEPQAFRKRLELFHRDLDGMKSLVADPVNDLAARIPHGTGQTLFREALLVGDHTSYHIGQVIDLRRLLGVPVRDW